MLLLFIDKIELPELQKKRLVSSLPEHNRSFVAQKFYCIQIVAESLTKAALADFEAILTAERFPSIDNIPGQLFIVPRLGTISPWCSKATDIFYQCGYHIERIEQGILCQWEQISDDDKQLIVKNALMHDPMTQSVLLKSSDISQLFTTHSPAALQQIPLLSQGIAALKCANQQLGLALSESEMQYLLTMYQHLDRDPSDAELMMFAQANSEHCRHKIFNAQFTLNGRLETESLFDKIKYTYQCHSENVLSAYADNSAVIHGHKTDFWHRGADFQYLFTEEPIHILMKVETHNHPTAISPFAGAATGAGGELRDEGATGRGGRPKAGMTGFCVSDLHIPNLPQPWEHPLGKPEHLCDALQIMLAAPIGSASYNNEFGRPNIAGFFRSYCHEVSAQHFRGYHKPIMIAGGYGNIREQHIEKQSLPVNAALIVIGGPAMEIGLGGGAASSKMTQAADADLDYASVQRGNPEIQRRCQEVIDYCLSLGNQNPILSIHDVGAGGLSNAFPELIHDAGRGGIFRLRDIPNAESGMSPLAIWCNEAQERYVLGIEKDNLADFAKIATRERCPYAVVGETTVQQNLVVFDTLFENNPVDLPLPKLLGNMPKMQRNAVTFTSQGQKIDWQGIELSQAIQRVLQLPSVASKQFLITIGDRTIGGHVVRDQMVGPWQVPVSDVAVTTSSYLDFCGEALAIGERPPLALINPAASARMAVAEMITNIVAADISELTDIKLSANWMAACGEESEDGGLFSAVDALAKEFCPALGLTIPVGKDSLSMQTSWQQQDKLYSVKAPLSLTITGFAPVRDVRKTLTPELQQSGSTLYLIDLAAGAMRLGGSALLQTYQQLGDDVPDINDPQRLIDFFACMTQLKQQQLLLAYHDRSDGGLLTTLAEMTFASQLGWEIDITQFGTDQLAILFNEELGAVVEVSPANKTQFITLLKQSNLDKICHELGTTLDTDTMRVTHQGNTIISASRTQWQQWWHQVSYELQSLRDNPDCARQEFTNIAKSTPDLFAKLTFEPTQFMILKNNYRPKVAILREQGVNGHMEMAAAFHLAGFQVVDVHMSDIVNGLEDLSTMVGLVACGGFSYGDVLGAGRGWANAILYNHIAKKVFKQFFSRKNTFTLGVCNGCQMLSQLTSIIPGAEHFPTFTHNLSAQFEARLSMVEITETKSIFFKNMAGSQLPIAVAHGEGQAIYKSNQTKKHISMRYINAEGQPTEAYPANPNGSPEGITAVTSEDGRVTIMMPHPERVFRRVQFSWAPKIWSEMSPWFTMFVNAYHWVCEN